jgi:tetratricopeptide (TPR) repeat protein
VDLLSGTVAFLLAAIGAAQSSAPPPPPAPWAQAWTDLARLEESVPGSPEFERIRRDLAGLQDREDRGARKSRDVPNGYRAQILRAHLARLRGAPFKPVADPGSELPLYAGEAWIALQVAGPGPLRVRAVSGSLDEARKSDLPPRVERGLEATEEDARNLKLDWAIAEARALHDRSADRRTARLLARVLRLRGESEAAADLLQQTLRVAVDPADRAALRDDLGEVRLAAGDEVAAVREFGAALALGSGRAAEHLASRALSEGRIDRARALYRSLLDGAYRKSGASRAYGLALLAPRPAEAPVPGAPEAGLARNSPGSPN